MSELTFEEQVELASSLRYLVEFGALAGNGNRIPSDDRIAQARKMDKLREEARRKLTSPARKWKELQTLYF